MKKINKPSLKQLLVVSIFCLGLNSGAYTQEDQSIELPTDLDTQYSQDNSLPAELDSEPAWVVPEPDQVAMQAADEVAKQMVDTVANYKLCLRAVIASDSPVAGKQQEIESQCQVQRQQIVITMPQDLQEFMLLNMDRRVNLVLRTMLEAEGVVDDAVEDIAEAVVELSTEEDP